MLRRLLVWIVLLALPLQGIAAPAMVRCGGEAAHHSAAEDRVVAALGHVADLAKHDHATHRASSGHDATLDRDGTMMHAAQDSGVDHTTSGRASTGHESAGHDTQDRDAPCCAAAFAITAALPVDFPAAGSWADLVYVPGALPAVYLEGLRRPPRLTEA